MKPRIIVEISGGVCVAVYADQPVNVDLLDWDNTEYMLENNVIDPEHVKLEAETKKLKAYL